MAQRPMTAASLKACRPYHSIRVVTRGASPYPRAVAVSAAACLSAPVILAPSFATPLE